MFKIIIPGITELTAAIRQLTDSIDLVGEYMRPKLTPEQAEALRKPLISHPDKIGDK